MIDSKDVTFVVQGAIEQDNDNTKKALLSIRKYFPKSIIILSTWLESNVDDLSYDSILFNIDPGAKTLLFSDREAKNNINRQIVSTINGLKKVETIYAVKTRTDNIFTSNKLLSLFQMYNKYGGRFNNLTENRVLALSNYLSANPHKTNMPYHVGDFFYAGKTTDLLELFSIELMSEEDMRWFECHIMPSSSNMRNFIPRYTAEQYIIYSFLNKKISIKFDNAFDINNDNIEISEKIIGNNFALLNSKTIGIENLKYPLTFKYWFKLQNMYTECDWKKLSAIESKKFIICFDYESYKYLLAKFVKYLYKAIKPLILKKNSSKYLGKRK